jgi:hypothetical protein
MKQHVPCALFIETDVTKGRIVGAFTEIRYGSVTLDMFKLPSARYVNIEIVIEPRDPFQVIVM